MTNVTVSKAVRSGRPALRVTWTVPQSDASISQYQVQYKRRVVSSRSMSDTVPSATTVSYIEDLLADSQYQVQVRAVSTIGNGLWSVVQSEETYMCKFSDETVV